MLIFEFNRKVLALISTLILFQLSAMAQISDLFNGVQFKDSLHVVEAKLSEHCTSIKTIKVEKPIFPLAEKEEAHLIIEELNLYNGFVKFQEVAFVFSDSKLSHVEARGEGVNLLLEHKIYDKYRVFSGPDYKIVNEEEKALWILEDEGLHTNLFAWSNPYLPSNKEISPTYNTSATVPSFFKMDGQLQEMLPFIEENSSFVHRQESTDGELQLNCFGIEYAGFPRKMEAKFKDGQLYMIWILTAKQEESRIRKALEEAYGKVIFENESWEVFNNWQVMLRKDKPEVLVLSKEKALYYKESYFNQK